MKSFDRETARKKRHARIRKNIAGTAERPRLVIHRSIGNIEGQIIDDTRGVTLVGLSSLAGEIDRKGKKKTEVCRIVGAALAKKAVEKGITRVVFDRGGYIYHGRVKAFADGAREGGLDF